MRLIRYSIQDIQRSCSEGGSHQGSYPHCAHCTLRSVRTYKKRQCKILFSLPLLTL